MTLFSRLETAKGGHITRGDPRLPSRDGKRDHADTTVKLAKKGRTIHSDDVAAAEDQ
jgi:hypothetical protein